MPDLIDREALLRTLSQCAPLCREPQVAMMSNGCTCWLGISQAIGIIERMEGSANG